MTASRTERRAAVAAALLAACASLLATGCAQKPPPPGPDILMPLTRPTTWLPGPADRAAAQAARGALAGDRKEMILAVDVVRATDPARKGEDLDALCQDLVNATLDDPRTYRRASRELTRGWGTDPSIEARLEEAIKDDPIRLAWKRRRDTWHEYFARTFNAASEPLGQAIFSGFVLAPATIATSTAHYLASFSNDEPLSTTDRQALVLRREHLARHPDAEDADKVRRQIEGAEKKLAKTMQRRRMRAARLAHDAGSHRLAVLEAERVLHWGPHEGATEIRDESLARIADAHALAERSLGAAPLLAPNATDAEARALAVELLATSSTRAPLSDETVRSLRARRDGPGSGEAMFVFAMAQHEAGYEDEGWRTLLALAERDPEASHMARHARHLITNAWQNPYKAYRDMRSRKRGDEIKWRLFSSYANGARYPNLPKPIAYTLEAPGLATALVMSPVRMIFGRWKKGPDFHRPSAVLGYRYLGLHPEGAHSKEIMQWLYEYEKSRDNAAGALRLADFLPDTDPDERTALTEAASSRALAAADRIDRPDRRSQVLRHASTEYPDTEAGLTAGKRIRWELERASPQKISVTRSFLQENPRVAGPNGLGINPILINGENGDGELHPMGVTFIGGRQLRFYLLAETGDEEDEPDEIVKTVSGERLARLAAVLDETTRRNQLIDSDDTLGADADRDRFLERARLGLLDRTDERPTAQSTYVYRSMRERYGVVRGRESILPFDLVFQGSVQDFRLGAFPRWRPPKETPDAFLYK